MENSNEKRRLYLYTFVAISAAILIIGFIGVTYSISITKERYIDQQLESNRRTANTVAKILSDQIEMGASEQDVRDSFQNAIAGSHINEGYLCMFDTKKSVLVCHPDSSAIGRKIEGNRFQFRNLRESRDELFSEAITSDGQEGGILSLQGAGRSEITYMVPVRETHWKVSVHENLDRIEEKLGILKTRAYIGFAVLALFISLISSFISRRINAAYEKRIESQKEELHNNYEVQKSLNAQIKSQKATIEEYAETLEQKVKERTRQLEKANAKLADLEKAKSDFLGIISHELRTPLNGIIGFSDILEQELNQEEHKEFVQNIKKSGRRLIKFSETAMLITELSSNYMALKFERVKANELFDEVHDEFSEQLQNKNIALEKEDMSTDSEIDVVPGLVKQCFSNILDNAIRYTPENGSIKVKSFEDEKHSYVCEIKDSGPGFSREARDKLFDYFGSDKVMHHKEGFGLGLAAAKLIMEAHSGNIEIDNCNEGARVRIIFSNQNSS